MAIEIHTKRTTKTSILINILFYLSILLLIGSTVGFFTFNYLERKTKDELESTEEELQKVTEKEMEGMERKLIKIEKKSKNLKQIIGSKREASDAITYLENICHPKVYFSNANITPEKEFQFKIAGVADSYRALEQQLLILRNNEVANDFRLKSLSMNKEGGINFEIDLNTASNIFY